MRWQFGRRSDNIEDRRGNSGSSTAIIGGGLGTIILVVVVTLLGGDPTIILQQANNSPGNISSTPRTSPQEEELADFVSVVLADTEDTWSKLFRQAGATYQEPTLVLFRDGVNSACGFAQSAVGPFYCPSDRKVYIDLSFYEDLKYQHQAPGDFAQAYVIAHEVGHHVQNLLGVSQQVQARKRQVSTTEANQLSVKLELQADCFAGIWAHHANRDRQVIEPGDVEEALNAASQIGDDRLQMKSRGYITPDSFTHGSSEQRMRWFMQGLKTGDLNQCNTFN